MEGVVCGAGADNAGATAIDVGAATAKAVGGVLSKRAGCADVDAAYVVGAGPLSSSVQTAKDEVGFLFVVSE